MFFKNCTKLHGLCNTTIKIPVFNISNAHKYNIIVFFNKQNAQKKSKPETRSEACIQKQTSRAEHATCCMRKSFATPIER